VATFAPIAGKTNTRTRCVASRHEEEEREDTRSIVPRVTVLLRGEDYLRPVDQGGPKDASFHSTLPVDNEKKKNN